MMRMPMSAAAACAMALAAAANPVIPGAAERWRGFNINTLASPKNAELAGGRYDERDFALLQEWGLNFVRLTLGYPLWIVDGDWNRIDTNALVRVDEGVAFARKHGLHVMLNFHRAPGWTVQRPYEKAVVFLEPATLEVCKRHWTEFARRYRDVPAREMSFNLFNEPPHWLSDAKHTATCKALVDAIRAVDPKRPICIDGLKGGKLPPMGLVRMRLDNVFFAMRGYSADPDAAFAAWQPAFDAGAKVFMGEFAVDWSVPREEALWRVRRYLERMEELNMGWAWWELLGGRGVMNKHAYRKDAVYEDFRGVKLFREMLDLLLAH